MPITLNAGSGGSTLATEQIGTTEYQQVKLISGTTSSTGVIAGGGGAEANALRVTIANDSTGVLSIDDNGGSLTIDSSDLQTIASAVSTSGGLVVNLGANNDVTLATLPDTGSGDLATIASETGSIDANVTTIAGTVSQNRIAVSIETDLVGIGGGIQYAESATAASATGTLAMMEAGANAMEPIQGDKTNGLLVNLGANNDVTITGTATVSGTELETIASAVSTSGGLVVNLGANNDVTISATAQVAHTGLDTLAGAVYTEDSVRPVNPTGIPFMMERDDVLGGITPAASDWTHPFCNANGALWVAVDSTDPVTTEDTASATGDPVVPAGVIRDDALAAGAGVSLDGDYTALRVDNNGALWIKESAALDVSAATVTVAGSDLSTISSAVSTSGGLVVNLGANNDVTVTGTVQVGHTGLDTIASALVTEGTTYATSTGNTNLLVREDTPTSLQADNQFLAQRGTQYGAGFVQVVDSSGNFIDTFGGSGGTASTDDGAFTAGVGQGTPAMGFFSSDTVDANDVGVLAMDAERRLIVSISTDLAGIGGGIQYAESATAASATGTLAMMEAAGNAMEPLQGDKTNGLLVNLGANNDVAVTGTVTVSGTELETIESAISTSGGLVVNLGANNDVTVTGTATVSGTELETIASAISTSGGLVVNLGANNDITGTVTANAGTGTFTIQEAAAMNVSAATVQVGHAGLDELAAAINTNRVDVNIAASAATALVSGTELETIAGAIAGTEMQTDIVSIQAQTAGGASYYNDNDLDETVVSIKSSQGTFYGGTAINLSSAVLYVQVFNTTSNGVTLGVTTPAFEFAIPTQAHTSDGAGIAIPVPPCGVALGSAISAACTTNSRGSGAPGANVCHVNFWYQ